MEKMSVYQLVAALEGQGVDAIVGPKHYPVHELCYAAEAALKGGGTLTIKDAELLRD